MNKETRSAIERATQGGRKLLEDDFAAQLEGDFDVSQDGTVAARAGRHLSASQAFQRERIIAAIEHKRAAGMSPDEAARDYLRDAAFTTLNRFVALKMLEARELVQESITRGEQSSGYREFCGMAPSLPLLPDSAGYRLYIESLFDELSTEVKVLFDRRDASSVLWPKRATFEQLLEVLNASELARVWSEEETIGWFYQFFNSQDERRKMREGSQAPRNSRELAVRNQFFTPRYVVQFLTDNTLGRIWYEMRRTRTVLAERCEYMVRKSREEVAPRTKKDPRDLRVLDPACGSGHFLLYAFDLLLTIYEEAYADAESPKSDVSGKTLADDFPSLEALRKSVPGLVLAHNLHGVDIDPRCAQIAQLALWMRAQKAYRDFGIVRADRAQIRRSNIVVAEPLVVDDQTAKEFIAQLGDAELDRVFTSLVKSLSLAGDMGLLLRVERLVANRVGRGQTADLFAPPEQRIRRTLDAFAGEGVATLNPNRRLFVDDATNGVGLLNLAELRFDVAVMNPPFGQFTSRSLELAKSEYEGSSNDIFATFVTRALELSTSDGLIGVLSSRLGFFLEGLESWRHQLLKQDAGLSLILDLGYGVLDDALVETAAYVVSPRTQSRTLTAIRVLRDRDKAARTLELVKQLAVADETPRDVFFRPRAELAATPGKVVAYWLPPALLRLLSQNRDLGADGVVAYSGLQTDDDYRFLRLWWEVDIKSDRWLPFAKGGEYQPYADDLHLVVNWASDGREMKAFVESKYRQWSRHIKNTDRYFLGGLTYTERTTSDISIRAFPRNAIFSVSGPAIQCASDETLMLAWCVLSSRAGRALMDTLVGSGDTSKSGTAARHYRTRLVAALPSVSSGISPQGQRGLKEHLRVLWNANQSVQVRKETHRLYGGFVVPPGSGSFESAALAELKADALDFVEASVASAAIDRLVADAFGLPDEAALSDFAGPHPSSPPFRLDAPPLNEVLARVLQLSDEDLTTLALASGLDGRVATKRAYFYSRQFELTCLIAGRSSEHIMGAVDHIEPRHLLQRRSELAAQAMSVAVGVAFGRWSAPWTSREALRRTVVNADPFAPLPPSSPAMGDLRRRDILVDDDGHDDDILAVVNEAASKAVGMSLQRVEEAFGASPRDALREEFFNSHLAEYSNSRRKAPIYWQLATPSTSYSVWLYIHAFSRDTLFRVQNDYVAAKLVHEERRLDALMSEARDATTAAQRKAVGAQEVLVEELRAFLDEVKRVAPLWNPNLDDGVIINFSLLWRLVPQNKSLQKELKSTWDSLCAGEYDWAHLAMHLWPERVVPTCAKDRSLAIAHGLDDVFWVEGADSKWTARKSPTRGVDELVRERTSPAVKSALKGLLDAPVASGKSAGRKGGRRKTPLVDGGDA